MAGLVPAIPVVKVLALCIGDRRDKPGDDVLGWFDVIGICPGACGPR